MKYERLTMVNNGFIDTNCRSCKQCKKVGRKYICNDMTACNEEIVEILSKIKWDTYIRFSCDKDYQMPYFENVIKLFRKYHIPLSKIFVYVLVQKDLESADKRIQYLHNLCHSINIYAQAERNELLGIKPNKLQLEFAQRYVYGRCYKKETWNEYCKRHNLGE